MTTVREALDAQVTEKAFQRQLVNQLREWGWWVTYQTISYRSAPGWPDLFCVRERDGRIVAIECKTVRGKVSAAQQEVMDRLESTGKIEAYVFHPGEWERIAEVMFA